MAGTVEQAQRRVPSPAGFRGLLLLFARKLLLDPLVLQLATASLATWLMAIGRAALRSPWDPVIDGMVGAYDLVALASLLLRALGIRRWIPRGAGPRRTSEGADRPSRPSARVSNLEGRPYREQPRAIAQGADHRAQHLDLDLAKHASRKAVDGEEPEHILDRDAKRPSQSFASLQP